MFILGTDGVDLTHGNIAFCIPNTLQQTFSSDIKYPQYMHAKGFLAGMIAQMVIYCITIIREQHCLLFQ